MQSKPENNNNTTNVSTTTGFEVGASAGGSKDGPEASISAAYSSSTTRRYDIPDFRVIKNSDAHYARFDYTMTKTMQESSA